MNVTLPVRQHQVGWRERLAAMKAGQTPVTSQITDQLIAEAAEILGFLKTDPPRYIVRLSVVDPDPSVRAHTAERVRLSALGYTREAAWLMFQVHLSRPGVQRGTERVRIVRLPEPERGQS